MEGWELVWGSPFLPRVAETWSVQEVYCANSSPSLCGEKTWRRKVWDESSFFLLLSSKQKECRASSVYGSGGKKDQLEVDFYTEECDKCKQLVEEIKEKHGGTWVVQCWGRPSLWGASMWCIFLVWHFWCIFWHHQTFKRRFTRQQKNSVMPWPLDKRIWIAIALIVHASSVSGLVDLEFFQACYDSQRRDCFVECDGNSFLELVHTCFKRDP